MESTFYKNDRFESQRSVTSLKPPCVVFNPLQSGVQHTRTSFPQKRESPQYEKTIRTLTIGSFLSLRIISLLKKYRDTLSVLKAKWLAFNPAKAEISSCKKYYKQPRK